MVTAITEHPRVFISYSHDSPDHMDNVLALSDHLRADGVDCYIDQYEESPLEGWPRWMHNEIGKAKYVLIICTELYKSRFEGSDKKVGKGSNWEGAVITQDLYDEEGAGAKFIPVLLHPDDFNHIPDILRGVTHYKINTELGYERLYRRLTNQPLVLVPPLGAVRSLPPRMLKRSLF